MNTKLICTGLLGLAVLMSPAALAEAPAATPGTPLAIEGNITGATLAKLPVVNGVTPNTNARYYFFVSSASWCGPCRSIMPHIVKEYENIKATGDVEVVLVSFDHSWEAAKKYADHYKMPFAMVMHQDVQAQKLQGFPEVHGIPHAVLINAEGRMLGQGHGSLMQHWKKAIETSEAALKLEAEKKAADEGKSVTLYREQPLLAQMAFDTDDGASAGDDDDEPKAKKKKKKSKKKAKKDKEKKSKYACEVGEQISKLKFLNKNKPNPKAEYFIYLSSASWCGPCRALHPQIVAKYKDMKKDKVELILVSNDRDEASGKAYADGYPCPAIMDAQSSKLPGFSPANGIPQAIIVNGKGEQLAVGHGSIALHYEGHIKQAEDAAGDDAASDDEADASDDEGEEEDKPKKKKKKKGSKKK